MGICINRLIYTFKRERDIAWIVADFQRRSNLVNAASGTEFDIMLQCADNDCSTHGVTGNTDLIHINAVHIRRTGIDKINHVGKVQCGRVGKTSGRRGSVTKCVTGNDDETSACQLHHIHILHLQIMLAAVLKDDQGELVIR